MKELLPNHWIQALGVLGVGVLVLATIGWYRGQKYLHELVSQETIDTNAI